MQGTDYPQSWYPVARSRDLPPGTHRPLEAFGTEWLLFRTHAGRAGLTGRHCCHMGADLARGKVRGETLECALHGWRFDVHGRCTHVPGLPAPPAAGLHRLTCCERYGIVFAFWGNDPGFELPCPPGMEGSLDGSTPYVLDLETEYHAPSLNTFDVQHFERIHNRRFTGTPDISRLNRFCLRIDYVAEILKKRWVDHVMAALGPPRTTVTIDCWGSSLLLLRNRETGFGGLVAMLPTRSGQCTVFIVALQESSAAMGTTARLASRARVELGGLLMRGFLRPDVNVISRMRPFRGHWLEGIDYGAQQYWDFFRELPRRSAGHRPAER